MKKKLIKSASIVALSAVMMCGAAVSFAGCGSQQNAYQIRVSMFCADSDKPLNNGICDQWAKDYTAKLRETGVFTEEDKDITIKFSSMSDTDAYFSALQKQIVSNNQPDVFYVSPKYVKTWKKLGKVLDLSPSLAQDAETLQDVWEDSLAFYSYSDSPNYTSGDRIEFDASKNKFVTVKNRTEVGIYGLPKDYSNFGLGFNSLYFTEDVRKALTSKRTDDRDGVAGAQYEGSKITYDGETGVITADPDGEDDLPLINIGVPTYYRPYNFYRFDSYESAVNGGDPMATAVDYYTGGEGYCVTIPGFPGDTLEYAAEHYGKYESTSDSWGNPDAEIKNADPNAVYDATQGYITYTYAEYSALTWAVTYYINTYDWDGHGVGGFTTNTGRKTVYGNDQYDGVLYLLPWLAGNDAQYLNEDSTKVINPGKKGDKKSTDLVLDTDAATYSFTKTTLSGDEESCDIYWGANSKRFSDVVGAFHAYGSDWNGNSNNAGDTSESKPSGWDLFVAGNCVFYGVGTWNGGALNATSRDYLQYRLMPEPVSEDYALASYIKNADYDMEGYVWDAATGKKDPSKSTNFSAPEKFSGQDVINNQIVRQDKWGARMDSVGYGVSANAKNGGDWREAAAVDLVRTLAITPSTQVTLTYAGAQLPNFKTQCKDFLNNKNDFADMITPDHVGPEYTGMNNWDNVYAIAEEMFKSASDKSATVKSWIDAYKQAHPEAAGLKYDTSFDNERLSGFANMSYPMKILYLVSYTREDRDLSLRMQYGLNATRDSAMYTYNDNWLGALEPRQKNFVMAYSNQKTYTQAVDKVTMLNVLRQYVLKGADAASDRLPKKGNDKYGTPQWFCLHQAQLSQDDLDKAIKEEQAIMK